MLYLVDGKLTKHVAALSVEHLGKESLNVGTVLVELLFDCRIDVVVGNVVVGLVGLVGSFELKVIKILRVDQLIAKDFSLLHVET